jgi:molybdate transport system substrate-binding protein
VSSRIRARLAAVLVLLLLAGCGSARGSTADDPLLVAAASDLQPAFRELGERYTQQTGRPVTFTFGSSGQLAQQLANGAPYDVFASADVRYVEQVLAAGRGEVGTQAEYALGRLAIWSRDEPVRLDQLAEPRFGRIALANPEHAPYGRAAEQALSSAGALDPDRLVFGENVTDTLRLATSGNADVAVVALSVAQTAEGHVTPVPAAAHEPLRQALVVTGRPAAATLFAGLVTSDMGRAVLARHGFAPPQRG